MAPALRHITLLLIALAGSLPLRAQPPFPAGARQAALGGNSLLAEDAFTGLNNPALITEKETWKAGLWAERRFGLPELTNGALSFSYAPKKYGRFALGLASYGANSYYRQWKASLTYGMKLTDRVSAGVGFHAVGTSVPRYGNRVEAPGELALLYKIDPRWKIALSIWNPIFRPAGGDAPRATLPFVARAAVGYDLSEQVRLLAEAEKQSGSPLSGKGGIRYRPAPWAEVMAGVRSLRGPTGTQWAYSFGLGLNKKGFSAVFAFSSYAALGESPHLSLEYAPTPADSL